MRTTDTDQKTVSIIGGGPTGLIAAQFLAESGISVTIYEAKPSVARKFLLAGRGGLNLTHSEDLKLFVTRYYEKENWVGNWIKTFSPNDLRAWANNLGIDTFVGSSGRVFPDDFRAKGTLRAWLNKLEKLNVVIKPRYRWLGFNEDGSLKIQNQNKEIENIQSDAYLFACGGGSYAHMGADGKWKDIFQKADIKCHPFKASNVGFTVNWSEYFLQKFHGQPIKNISLKFGVNIKAGEIMLTRYGIEGGAIYGLSAALREGLSHDGKAILLIDLKPDMNEAQLKSKLARGPGRKSLSSFLRSHLKLSPQAIALLREFSQIEQLQDMKALAALIKSCPINLSGVAPMDRAISTAGGVIQEAVDQNLMLKQKPGSFVAGEMLDWEAPTGGYLLQASFASGVHAAHGIIDYLHSPK